MDFHDLADRLAEVRGRIEAAVSRGGHGQHVTIVAVTKTHGADAVEAAYAPDCTMWVRIACRKRARRWMR